MATLLLIFFTSCAVFQIVYHLYVFGRQWLHDDIEEEPEHWPAVSIVIAARNEASNLAAYLPKVLNQDYPGEWEIVVANDRSRDESDKILAELQASHKHLNVINIKDDTSIKHQGKKYALDKAIRVAKYDRLLFTDADCWPNSTQWVRQMIQQCSNDETIILGIGQYAKKKNLLNSLIQFETFLTANQYHSLALLKEPYMGVGRNLSYSKKSYEEVGGFQSHEDLLSGDDDLFINQIGRNHSCKIAVSKDSQTYSEPPENWSQWTHQKKRHYSTAKRYRIHHQVILGSYALTHFGFHISFLLILLWGIGLKFVLILATQKCIVQLLNFNTAYKSQQFSAHYPLWLMDVIFVIYYVMHLPSVLTSTKRKW